MRFLTSFFIFIFFEIVCSKLLTGQTAHSLLYKKYSPAELRQDACILKDVILSMHPAVGIYQSEKYYNQLFDNYIHSIQDSLTEKQFRIKTKFVLNELHCGHTECIYSKALYREVSKKVWNFSPYIFIPVNDKLYVMANLNRKRDSVLIQGAEVLSINGIKTDSLLNRSRRFVSSDGFNTSAKYHFVQLGFNSYVLGLFSRPDTFVVEYLENGMIKTHKYAAQKTNALPNLPIGPVHDSLLKLNKRTGISYRFLDEEHKSFYLKLDKFSHSGFSRTYRKSFKKCKKDSTENLVIDLRNNGGGSLANSYQLLSYLIDSSATQTLITRRKNYPLRKYTKGNFWFKSTRWVYTFIAKKNSRNDTDYFSYTIKPKTKWHYDNKILVLINGGSFSASCLVAAYLKNNARVTFIGEETGGTIEGCNAGVTPYYTLPHSHIRVRVPAFRVQNDCCVGSSGHGIEPDVEIKYSFKDLVLRKDLEMNKVLELITMKQN